ncbi:sensor histidine kinase [Pilimelia columellifera]|uniref:histidine kinase n=1 Tax=Pilimelia columellifera subsp. columellifera TaxID=706583 RepID=A0ABP6AUY9_9ACTN
MSRNTTASDTAVARLRRPMGRLRDAPIWAKLGLIMIVPTIATVIVGTNGLIGHIQTQASAERARNLAGLSQSAGQLVHDLQNERASGSMLLSAPDGAARERARQSFESASGAVSRSVAPYTQQRSALTGLPGNVRGLLDDVDNHLAALDGVRSQVRDGKIALTDAAFSYQTLLSDLLSVRDAGAHLADDNALNAHMRAATEVSRIKDFMSQRRVVVHQILGAGAYTPKLQIDYLSTQSGERQAVATFRTVATLEERQRYEQTVSGSGLRKAETYEGYLNSQRADSRLPERPFNAEQWDTAMREQGELLRQVERSLDRQAAIDATAIRDDVRQRVLLETGLLLGMLLLAVLFAWLVARSMARSLRELKHGALAVAERGLPQAVARLRDPSLSANLSPAQAALQIAEPLPVRSNDEFGQVTEAFNAVHLEAVRTAAEQAALRASVSTMFVNLARRSQTLVDRLIGQLDRLERSEEDPDRLGELFQLDHLATRMRRNDENLLVLAGADSTRIQREPAALTDVLRAAQSEVEHYTRIDIGDLDTDALIAAQCVNDMVHLIAELFDNATAFSPPDSPIVVEGRQHGEQVLLQVTDRGIGISAEQMTELNRRLAMPPQVDVAISRMMGLVVVARLAARHGVKVELRAAPERGTIAEVLLPESVLSSSWAQSVPPAPEPSESATQRGRTDIGALVAADRPPPPASSAFVPVGARRELPAWPGDQPAGPAKALASHRAPTGVGTTSPPADGGGSGGPGGNDGLPRREPNPAPDGLVPSASDSGGFIPRQASSPESVDGQRPAVIIPSNGAPPPIAGAPTVSAPAALTGPSSATPADPTAPPTNGAASAPPAAWPPVAADATPIRELTAELPQLSATAAVADETMELPIFRELESVWFRSQPAGAEGPGLPSVAATPVAHAPAATENAAKVNGSVPGFKGSAPGTGPANGGSSPLEKRLGADPLNGTAPAARPAPATADATAVRSDPPAPSQRSASSERSGSSERSASPERVAADQRAGWRTAADDGWRAAQALADGAPAETTTAGLPKRTPMAQLVPGSIESESAAVQRRSPEGVRGLLSAYHRGVQRGRTSPRNDADSGAPSTPTGSPSTQARKEREA